MTQSANPIMATRDKLIDHIDDAFSPEIAHFAAYRNTPFTSAISRSLLRPSGSDSVPNWRESFP